MGGETGGGTAVPGADAEITVASLRKLVTFVSG